MIKELNNQISALDEYSLNKLRNTNKSVIIFGAGVMGEVLFYACGENGIKVECFCDNNTNLTKYPLCGLKIIDARNLKEVFDDAIFIISSTYMKEIVEQLNKYGYSEFYDCIHLIKNFDSSKYEYNSSKRSYGQKDYPNHYVEFFIDACVLSQNGYLYPDKLTMRNVDIVITEKCSMKCQDCSNLMQYYESPVNYSVDELHEEIDKLLEYVDAIYECRVIGGESG